MTTKSSTKNNILSNLEKILIGLIFASILIYYFTTGQKELKTTILYPSVLALEGLLLIYYIYRTQNLYSLFFIGFGILIVGYYEQPFQYELSKKLILMGEVSQFCLGLYLGYKTIQDSLKNKDWEMFGTLITVALLFPLVYRFALSGKELIMVYNFALAFMLGTIIYNENLWDKYNDSEKKILTYVLVSTLAEVLFISVKLI